MMFAEERDLRRRLIHQLVCLPQRLNTHSPPINAQSADIGTASTAHSSIPPSCYLLLSITITSLKVSVIEVQLSRSPINGQHKCQSPYLVLFLISSLRLCGFCFPLCLVLAARFCFPIPRLVLRPSRPGAGPLSPRLIPRIRPDPLFPGCVRTLAFLFGLLHRFPCYPSSLHLAVRLV